MQMYVSRTYVIERLPLATGEQAYGAFWPDRQGYATFQQRLIVTERTVTGVKEMMERHYPGSQCIYEPEENTAVLAAAAAMLEGEG